MLAHLGTTPTIDGTLAPGEWSDAFTFDTSQAAIGSHATGPNLWTAYFDNVTDAADLSLTGFCKRDKSKLYFGFNVTDNFLFAIDGPRWCPAANKDCTVLNQSGWPWFGDEMEILINAAPGGAYTGNGTHPYEEVIGNATQWQMVTSLTKSRLGGIGVGGLLEGEPRSSDTAWATYQGWIKSGKMKSAAKKHAAGKGSKGSKGYVMEWEIDYSLLQITAGQPYHTDMPDTQMGLNIAVGDVDRPEDSIKSKGGIRHEQWFSGDRPNRTHIVDFGTLWMMADSK